MKRRYRLLLNLCSLALLAFSLYLNFVKKDAPEMPVPIGSVQAAPAAPDNSQAQKTIVDKSHPQAAIAAK